MATFVIEKRERPRLDEPMKPLFIPLKTEYFEAFKSGDKKTELRKRGGRWSGQTCKIGRDVIISKGYGKKHRLYGYVVGWSDVPLRRLEKKDRDDFQACYGLEEDRVFVIDIELEPNPPTSEGR